MESPFAYSKVAIGSDFIGRKKELACLMDFIKNRRHSLIYDAPKTGKHSLVRQAFLKLKEERYEFIPIYLNFMTFRSFDSMLRHYAAAIMDAVRSFRPDSFTADIQDSFGFPEDQDTPLTVAQTDLIISLPERIGKEYSINPVVWLDEFQTILNFEDRDVAISTLESYFFKHEHVTYILMGSKINAMKHIFENVRYFLNFAEKIELSALEEKDVTERIYRNFVKMGRVVEPQQAHAIYESVEGHPWYIMSIANICFNLTRGYLNANIFNEAIQTVLYIHETRFMDIIDSLSSYQLRILRAVFDGVTKLNSQEVIEKYQLNSSANAHRLKEALTKKEVIAFDENDVPRIIDPLFHLWLKTRFFTE